jgi:hypothetical protein
LVHRIVSVTYNTNSSIYRCLRIHGVKVLTRARSTSCIMPIHAAAIPIFYILPQRISPLLSSALFPLHFACLSVLLSTCFRGALQLFPRCFTSVSLYLQPLSNTNYIPHDAYHAIRSYFTLFEHILRAQYECARIYLLKQSDHISHYLSTI